MKNFHNPLSLKMRKNFSKKNSEMDNLVKVFNNTCKYHYVHDSEVPFEMSLEIADKNEEIKFIQQQMLKSKYYQRA